MLPLGRRKWHCVASGFVVAILLALGAAIMLERVSEFPINLHRKNGLAFRDKSSFKISIFADLHYGENAWDAWGPVQDVNSSRVMDFVLDVEKPDFVIFLGDVITANNLATANATLYWDKAIASTAKRSIPWASVLGNHDDAAFEWPVDWFGPAGIPGFCSDSELPSSSLYFSGTTRAELMNHEVQQRLSISLNGGGTYAEVISAHQATWFQQVAIDNNPDGRTPEIVFWHIPSQAFDSVSPTPNGPISSPCFGTINLETVASQVGEWGIMNILKNRPSVKAVIVGHNHGLDWCCPYEKLWLCFARHTGYGGYGTWTRGARQLELTEDPFQIRTWILLENGTKTSARILYPRSKEMATSNIKTPSGTLA
ncbi:hypothetical protein O6H91_15G061000 [Diphasiastrum complanatum]|uniref:Uncharacterized protein n=1 Tax=Diphasiastrum complanatum TaxID=34168 RepID=A0ACC2BIQ3_DIPCM|nr:hypothetical protein O6H91_15G061000 [Diphasiastrum complanatum]